MDTRSVSRTTVLVKFEYGTTTVRLCRWDADLAVTGDGTYVAEPTLDVKHGRASMLLQDLPCRVACRKDVQPFKSAATGRAHAPIRITAWRANADNPDERRMIFRHNVGSVRRFPSGSIEMVQFDTTPIKNLLDRTIHLTTNPSCEHIFGGGNSPGCGFNLGANKAQVTVDAIGDPTPTTIRVTTNNSPDYSSPERWSQGYAEYAGLRIPVRKYYNLSGVDYFELSKIPPSGSVSEYPDTWEDADIEIFMGCDKTLTLCELHGRTADRLAPGEGVPDYHPVAEVN